MRWSPARERFWVKVEKTGSCWQWRGCLSDTGYGNFYDSRRWLAHRYSWDIHVGPIPRGMCVLHHCDNRACVRPDHLFLGTKRQNSQDMVMKGRHRVPSLKGSQHGEAKLTERDVLSILRTYKRGNGRELAKKYDVSPSLISLIVRRKAWTHV
jgi:hypothetical protein